MWRGERAPGDSDGLGDGVSLPENDVVEAQVMTKKMLRELAARRGVSYTELARQAEASGVELPDE